ncbi:MAG TPA: hypothetical protein VFX86_00525 [Candidatus Saccharimonadales bacterium]|nr:hypothetical protein [Candidatus Saccharimonadales bacterium]
MQKVKKTIKTALASLLLAGAFAVPASASTTNTNTTTVDSNNSTDKSKTYNLEECAGIVNTTVNQEQDVDADNEQDNDADSAGLINIGNDPEQDNEGSASANGSQSSSVNFSPDCSEVTNVTNVNESQVSKTPSGGVDSGAGGASEAVATSSILGLIGSVAALGAGAVLRLRGVEL